MAEKSRTGAWIASGLGIASPPSFPLPAPMLSVLRTPLRHLPTTISLLLLAGAALIVFVVQRLSASEAPLAPTVVTEALPVEAPAPESTSSRVRLQNAGPQGRKLPWVRWEYVP